MLRRCYGTSSKRWINRHQNDYYVKEAKALGYRSRAAFKLLEIDEKHNLLAKNRLIVELGAAPGSWTQVITKKVQRATIICVDLLHMDPVSCPAGTQIHYIQGDFTEPAIAEIVKTHLNNQQADIILSDMAPNTSGIASLDKGRSVQLCEMALEFAKEHLKPNGNLLVKVFAGEDEVEFRNELKKYFAQVKALKPKASRSESIETYLLALQFTAASSTLDPKC